MAKMNNMEIKQGDKVRVSDATPWIYTRNQYKGYDCKVEAVAGDGAIVSQLNVKFPIPTKYLIKVDAEAVAKPDTRKEREKQVFVIGERVRLDKYNGTCKHDGVIGTVCKITSISSKDDKDPSEWYYGIRVDGGKFPSPTSLSGFTDVLDGISVYDLIPAEDSAPTAPKFKVGDRIKFKNIYELQKVKDQSFRWMLVMFASKEATITAVEDNGFYRVDIDPSIGGINDDMIECKVEPTEQTEAKKKPNHTITIPVEVDLTDSYWDAYAADLAKEVALKVANKFNEPHEAAEYAVKVAKGVVEGLKRK